MAITFESIKDPYGLGAAGDALGSAFMKKSMMELQQRQQKESEDRQKEEQKKVSGALGQTLQEFMPTQEGESWDQNRVASFMSKALESGASMNDIINTVKLFQSQQKQATPVQTPFAKEMAKTNVGLIKSLGEQGRKAKELLGTWDELDSAIVDPSRFENFALRGLKQLPGASSQYSASDNTISAYGKEIISNFTNMKNLRLTDAKLKWLEGIAPAPWKSMEANKEASAYFKRVAQIQNAYGDIASNMANAYTEAGLDIPTNFEKLLEDAVEPLRKEIDAMYKSRPKESGAESAPVELGSTFNKMPNPKDYEGAEITDSKGNRYVSTGTKWRKVK